LAAPVGRRKEARGHIFRNEAISLVDYRLLDTGRLPAAANMALDKIILEEVAEGTSPPTLRFLQFSPAAALVGYHQDVNHEIRLDYCEAHGIDVNRRLTGGGAILFQESALGWEFFARPGHGPFRGGYENILHEICSVAAGAISRLGVTARFRPRNDIEVDGRKISGTGGVTVTGAFMFQGTLLMENEIQRFLKALRVPVEKLKKREVESLMERICFLSDLVSPTPDIGHVKKTIAEAFGRMFGIRLVPGELTSREQERLKLELPSFGGSEWILSRSRPQGESEPIRSLLQTAAGTLRVNLWLSPGGRRVRQALITGDFFCEPPRLIHDLEASLVGARAAGSSATAPRGSALRNAVLTFFEGYDGRIVGISPEEAAEAVAAAGERLHLIERAFSREEINELFLVNVHPLDLAHSRPRWLLLPYCAKNLDCGYRGVPGCSECGECEIGDCFALARSFDLEPVTIQSFEHLMEVLRAKCARSGGLYVGSCCEAFYSKHQKEMERVAAQGVLINLDSTTCYDLGKADAAYKGRFDRKTALNMALIEKTLSRLHAS